MQELKLRIENDQISLIKPLLPSVALSYVYHVTVRPQCQPYQHYFQHEEHITFFALTDDLLLDTGGISRFIKNGQFTDVMAHVPYRFRSLGEVPITLCAYAASPQVARSWSEAGLAVQDLALIGRDGITRFI